jgi:hypothetical protein
MANLIKGDKPRTNRTPKRRAAFLASLKETCNITKACELSGLSRTTAYDWRGDDPDFAVDWQKALDVAADLLEEEAVRRAKDGTLKPVYQGGELVGHIQEYSDTLMIFLLKGAKPQKYMERRAVEASGPSGGPIQAEIKIELVKTQNSNP